MLGSFLTPLNSGHGQVQVSRCGLMMRMDARGTFVRL